MADEVVFNPDFLFSRVVDVHFGNAYLYVTAAETTKGDPDDLSATAVGSANVGVVKGMQLLDQTRKQSSSVTPPKDSPETFYYIWSPEFPPADETNFNFIGFANHLIIGQYIWLRSVAAVAIGQAGIRATPEGTFTSLQDAQNALQIGQAAEDAFESQITNGAITHADLTTWMGMDGTIKNVANTLTTETLLVHNHVPGTSGANLVREWLYSVPTSPFGFTLSVNAPGPNPLCEASASIYTKVKGKITSIDAIKKQTADATAALASLQSSKTFTVKVDPAAKKPTVTVS